MTRQWDRLPPEARDYLDVTGKGLTFVCTDRGQHPRTALGTAGSQDGRPPYLWLPVNRARVAQQSHGGGLDPGVYLETPPNGRRTVHIRCWRCKRHRPWPERRANAKVSDALAAGITEVDVSLIP